MGSIKHAAIRLCSAFLGRVRFSTKEGWECFRLAKKLKLLDTGILCLSGDSLYTPSATYNEVVRPYFGSQAK